MNKINYYLWKHDFTSQETYQNARNTLIEKGFRPVTFINGQNLAIHEGLKKIIQNHYQPHSF